MVGEALVQGGEEQERPHGAFAGEGSAAHLHPMPETSPPAKVLLGDTERSRAVPVSLISEIAGICYVEISR